MDKKKNLIKPYLEVTEVLIVDKNPNSRNRLSKLMQDLGCPKDSTHTAGTIEEAQEIINTQKIGIVLSDYFIGGGSGFDLFKMLRERHPSTSELCLILVTSNISQAAVARAAEEDVDSFIIKPYTIESIKDNLMTTLTNKVFPSDYIQKVEEGKKLIKAGLYDQAVEVLEWALELHPKPSLALFYIGQCEYLRQELAGAQGSYHKGLAFNSIHYKCLVGLFDMYMREKKFPEAYQVVKTIAKFFPANPDRILQIIRLAVVTSNFQDMNTYYNIFTSMDFQNLEVKNYIGAGMFVAGKHCMRGDAQDLALQYFDKIAVSCSEFPKFGKAIYELLTEYGLQEEADRYKKKMEVLA